MDRYHVDDAGWMPAYIGQNRELVASENTINFNLKWGEREEEGERGNEQDEMRRMS